MELSVKQENLARALNAVSRVASNKSGLPILNNILIRTEGTRLLVAATNLEIATTCYIGAKVTKQGEITLPAKLLGEFISNLPHDTVDISSKGTVMSLSSGKFSSKLSGVDASDFPELPAIDEKEAVIYKITVADFKQAVSQTIVTSSSDTTRPVLMGVYWHSVDGYLYLASTDGYRLSERRLMKTKSEIDAIVPATSLQEVLRVINDSTEEVEVLFDDTQVRFRVGEAEITSRLIDGKYPDYRQLIPKESETIVDLKANDFSRIVKVAGLFARDSGGSITLEADEKDQQLVIRSIASELGENTSVADAKVSSNGQVTLNSRYVSEALSATEGDMIRFRFSGKISPCVLTAAKDDTNYIQVIMPLKS